MDELIGEVLETLFELIGERITDKLIKRLESISEEREEESNELEEVEYHKCKNWQNNKYCHGCQQDGRYACFKRS